jgi:hypothetical protein
MSLQTDLERINLEITELESRVELYESLKRLQQNKDFKSLIGEQYLVSKAANLTWARAYDEFQTEEKRQTLERSLDSIAYFKQFLMVIAQQGEMAMQQLSESKDTREKIQSEVGD